MAFWCKTEKNRQGFQKKRGTFTNKKRRSLVAANNPVVGFM